MERGAAAGVKRQSEANTGVAGRLGWWTGDDRVCQAGQRSNAVRRTPQHSLGSTFLRVYRQANAGECRATYVGLRAYCMAVAVCKRVLPVGVWVMGCAFNGALQTQGATCVVWLVVEVGRGHSRR